MRVAVINLVKNSFKRQCIIILKPNGKTALILNVQIMSYDVNIGWREVLKKYCPEFQRFCTEISESDIKSKAFSI